MSSVTIQPSQLRTTTVRGMILESQTRVLEKMSASNKHKIYKTFDILKKGGNKREVKHFHELRSHAHSCFFSPQ